MPISRMRGTAPCGCVRGTGRCAIPESSGRSCSEDSDKYRRGLVAQAVALLHQLLDCVRQMLFRNVVSPTLAPEAVRLHEDVRIAESFGRLKLVTGKLDGQTIRIFKVDRVHEATVTLIERDATIGETGGGFLERRL